MALLTKLLIAVLATVAGSWSPASGPLEFRRILVGTLDLIFTFALFAFIALQIDLFRVSPIEARGLDAIGPLLGALALAALKGFLFVLVPAILLTRFLRRFESLLPRIFIYGVFTALGFTGHHFAEQRAKANAEIAAAAVRRAEAERRNDPLSEVGMAEARINAEKREQDAQARYLNEFMEKSALVYARWRADIEAAGAIGVEGEAPPMISVYRVTDTEIKVTNVAGRRICMSVARVLRKPGTDEYERCAVDQWQQCREITNTNSGNFVLYRKPDSRACTDGHLEYRIGSPLRPEPSWWSRSALDEFDRNPPDLRKTHGSMPTLQLRGEIAQLDKQLAEVHRAERWRSERATGTFAP